MKEKYFNPNKTDIINNQIQNKCLHWVPPLIWYT